MKQAKASVEEAEKLLRWLQKSEDIGLEPPPYSRTVFGYLLMLEHCADPDQGVLAFKPEIAAAMSSFESAREDGA